LQHDRQQWQVVFIISAVIFVVGDLIYLAFGQMVTQPWDAPDFLDKERSPNLQEEGYSKALEAKESTNVDEAKRKEIEAGLESEEPKKKALNDEL